MGWTWAFWALAFLGLGLGFGLIKEMWEVDYTKFFVPVFKCKLVDNKSGVKINESGFTQVDF